MSVSTPWIPYSGGGVGWARISAEVKELDFDESDEVVAYQVGAGMEHRMSESATVFLEYRYFGPSDPEFERNGVKTTVEVDAHNLRLGFRIGFQTRILGNGTGCFGQPVPTLRSRSRKEPRPDRPHTIRERGAPEPLAAVADAGPLPARDR